MLTRRIEKLRTRIRQLESDTQQDQDAIAPAIHETYLELANLEEKRHAGSCLALAAKDALLGERINKYWMNVAKEKQPREIIYALKGPNPAGGDDIRATKFCDMANLTKDFYDGLQHQDPSPLAEAREEEEQASEKAAVTLASPRT